MANDPKSDTAKRTVWLSSARRPRSEKEWSALIADFHSLDVGDDWSPSVRAGAALGPLPDYGANLRAYQSALWQTRTVVFQLAGVPVSNARLEGVQMLRSSMEGVETALRDASVRLKKEIAQSEPRRKRAVALDTSDS